MRRRIPAARLLLVAALLAAAAATVVAFGSAFAASTRGPGVVVTLPGGSPTFVPADEIRAQADVPPTSYTLRAARDEPGRSVTRSGLSIRKLVTLAGGDPDTVAFVQIARPDGTALFLDGPDLADPPPFPEGPALVYVTGTTTQVFRPVRDDHDVNAPDRVTSRRGQPLALTGHTGKLLEVKASADRATAAPRTPVAFSARASAAQPGEKLTYVWRFGDGKRATGQRVSHAFAAIGAYDATVTVTGDRDSAGISAALPVRVGDVAPGAGGLGGATGPTGPAGAGGTGSGGYGGYGGGYGGYGGGSTPPLPAPGDGGAYSPVTPAPKAPPTAGRTPIPVGVPVDGILVASSAAPQPGAAGGAGSSGSRPSRGSRHRSARQRLEVPIVGGVAGLLILLGALAEQRAQRGRRPFRAMIPILR